MLDPVLLALILAGFIIVIGFLGNYLLERTGLPDMILLIVLGIIIGPLCGLVNALTVMALAPYLAALALVFILFDGGLAMNIYRVFAESPRAAILAVSGFGLSVLAVTFFMMYMIIPDKPWMYSMLFGTILGGSSSVVVVSLVSKIKIHEKSSTILSLESIITDILCIVFSIIIIEIVLKGYIEPTAIGQSVASRFSTGIVLGIVFGVIWLSILRRVVKVRASYSYMLTLAAVLLAYSLSEVLGGSGSLCSLVFGMILGNEREIYRMLRMETAQYPLIDEGIRRFESEIAFLLRTFFFVYIGLMVTISAINFILIGVVISLILLLMRYIAVRISTIRCSEVAEDRPIMSILLTRGLAAAVLATLPMQHAAENPTFGELAYLYVNVTVFVILATAIIATVGIPILTHKSKEPKEHQS
jgi:cell volume regulation protein A